MAEGTSGSVAGLPRDEEGTRFLLSVLTREVNLYVLFIHTWNAMGYAVGPDVLSELLALQGEVLQAGKHLQGGAADLEGLVKREEGVFRALMAEILRFKEDSEGFFPAIKMKFDPCF
jgi:hypothetical protein